MGKNTTPRVNEIIFGSSDQSRRITELVKRKQIKKIAPRIYTSNLIEAPERVIKRNWFRILGKLYPETLLSHRSALEYRPTPGGHVFLTYTYTEKIKLPGLTLHFLKVPE